MGVFAIMEPASMGARLTEIVVRLNVVKISAVSK
jgi:hypothetical protein